MAPLDPNIAITAAAGVIIAVPSFAAAWLSLRNGQKLKTNHGLNIGEHVERIGDQVYDLTRAFERHAEDDEYRFGEVLDRLTEQDRLAEAAKQADPSP